jgi:hypothetical protein
MVPKSKRGNISLTHSQTLEVAFARVYNWDVAQRRKEREGGESTEDQKKG